MIVTAWQPRRAADTSRNWRQSLFCCCTASMEQATDGAETAAIDGLVSSWSEIIFVSFCLRAPRLYGLTVTYSRSSSRGRNTSASVTVSSQRVRIACNAERCRGILSVLLSVRPSRSGIVSKGMKIWSCGFPLVSGEVKVYPDICRGSPTAGALKWGTPMSIAKIWPIIDHNLETVQDRR